MMEPKQKLLGTCRNIIKNAFETIRILLHGVASVRGTVEADACSVGAMIVARHPVRTRAGHITPWFRAIMVSESKDMVKPQRHHIIHNRFVRGKHHAPNALLNRIGHSSGIAIKMQRCPFVGYAFGRKTRIPRHAAEGIQIGVGHRMSGHTRIITYIRHTGNAAKTARLHILEKLVPHRSKECQMVGMAEIFLCYLQFGHLRRMRHGPEQGAVWFTRLKIHRPVLYLQYHIRRKIAVKRFEFLIGLFRTVGRCGIYERTPHHYTAMRGKCSCKHVGSVGMAAAIVARPRLAFRICLHEESSEIRHGIIHFIHFGIPPPTHVSVERIGRRQTVKSRRRSEVYRKIGTQAIRAQHIGQCPNFRKIFGRQHARRRVHIVKHDSVNADCGTTHGIVVNVRRHAVGQSIPAPNTATGISTLHCSVKIVPMVEQAQRISRNLHRIEIRRIGT